MDVTNSLKQVKNKAKEFSTGLGKYKEQVGEIQSLLKETHKDTSRIHHEYEKYQEQIEQLTNKRQIIGALYRHLSLTEHDKDILFGTDDTLSTDQEDED